MQRLGVVRLVLVASAVLALTACEGVKKQFGLAKQSPDEFRVVARAPLSLPPDFTLRPPEPGAVRPQEWTTAQQARKAIFQWPGKDLVPGHWNDLRRGPWQHRRPNPDWRRGRLFGFLSWRLALAGLKFRGYRDRARRAGADLGRLVSAVK